MLDEETHTLFVVYSYNMPEKILGLKLSLDDSLYSAIVEKGFAQRFDDFRSLSASLKPLFKENIKSLVLIPLIARGKTIGLIWAAREKQAPVFTDYDLVLIESIGGQVAVALDNISLFEQQRYISESLQRGFFPETLPSIKNTDIGIFYASATTAAIVGGDFYDAVNLDGNKIALFVGDVSGKGVEATSEAALSKYSLRAISYENPGPAKVLTTVNSIVISQLTSGHFITIVYLLYDTESGSIDLSIAGHPYPLFYSKKKHEVTPIMGEDPAIALIKDYIFKEISITMQKGDILVLYTDGVIESRHNHEFFGIERLSELVLRYADLDAQRIANKIMDDVRDFSYGKLSDDVVLMVIKRI